MNEITKHNENESSLPNKDRREFLLASTCALAGIGALCALTPFISSWMPSKKALAHAEPVEVDLSRLEPGEQAVVEWRGKPVWIIRRTQEMLRSLNHNNEQLRDPESLVAQQPSYAKNKYRSLNPEYLVLIGICTHLGCSPKYKPNLGEFGADWPGGFFCPCHGSTFDLAGRVFKGVPAPINLEVPPYHFLNEQTLVIGEDARKDRLMMNQLANWVNTRLPVLSSWKKHFSEYYVPKNLNILYLFGSFAMIILINQLATGLWLTMFYTPTAEQAFASLEFIMRDVNYGWLLRYMHSTGASAFFIVIYLHMFRGLLYGSYKKPRELVWILGMLLYLLLMAEAFFGYVLPWGQMSYWAAEVITSLVSAIPYIGEHLIVWVRGDYSVTTATLQRFFALHVIAVPLLMVFLVYLHIIALHHVGSNNPEGIEIKETLDEQGNPLDGIPFHPYYSVKEFAGIVAFLMIFFAIVFFIPEMGGYFLEPENFIPANPVVTPDHIAPAWYLAPFYAILRAIPNKLIGILCMAAAILLPIFIPWFDRSPVRSMRYKGMYSRTGLALFVISFLLLGYTGTAVMNPVNLIIARISSIIYFSYFILMPFYSRGELSHTVPMRIRSS